MGFGLKIAQKGWLLVAVPSIFEVAFVLILCAELGKAEHEAAVEAHSKTVIACANNLTRATVDAATASGAYKLTGNPLFADRSELALVGVRKNVTKLRELLKEHPDRIKDLDEIDLMVKKLIKLASSMKSKAEGGQSLAGLISGGGQFGALNRLVVKLGVRTNELISDELRIELDSPLQKARTREQIKIVLGAGVVLNVALAFIMAAYFSRSVTRRLLIVRENTERLSKRQDLVPQLAGGDEISDLDAAFHQAADRLKELEQFKQQLIGIVSHELKTPLSSMQVNIALMANGVTGELPEKAQKKLSVLETNVLRLIRLINDLLDIEKMESGKFELLLQDCSLARIIQVSLDSVTAFAADRKVELIVPETEFEIYADNDRVVQVLVNLLSNAIKYSPESSAVRVEVVQIEDLVELRVVDSGRGVPESHLEKIFDRFQQVEKRDETEKGGTGLGLAICKAIIEQHDGGSIGVISKVGEGSTFWFRLKKSAGADALAIPVQQDIKKDIV